MDVQLDAEAGDQGQDVVRNQGITEYQNSQQAPIRTMEDHTESSTKEAPSPDRMEKTDCAMIVDVSSNGISGSLTHCASTTIRTTEYPTDENSVPSLDESHTSGRTEANGVLPICTPPSAGRLRWLPPQSQKNNDHSLDKKRLPSTSTTNSQHSFKTTAAQIQQVAGDDCCVHCVLACLFCELLSLCSVLGQCLCCGRGCELLCCCCCGGEATGGVACGEDTCAAALDCGMLEDCCESSDCLEICLECCSICFPV